VISKILKILGLQPAISKAFTRTIFSHSRKNNFGNKIPFLIMSLCKNEANVEKKSLK
jgi:hypothetical protein